jgi:hypothetical protein
MQQSTGQPPLIKGLVIGDRVQRNPALQLLILFQIGLELEIELQSINRSISSHTAQGNVMRELTDMVTGMKQAVASLRSDAANAKGAFQSEVARAQVNTEKVKSFTAELNSANKEVEDFLGVTGSNFPTSGDTATPPVHADRNGVVLNKG